MSDHLNTYLNEFFYQGNICPSCNKGIEVRNTNESKYFGCVNCRAYLEKSGATFKIISKQNDLKKKKPSIDLYSKCAIDGATYEVIGYRYAKQKNFSYYWKEYILYNAHKPFIYLSEYEGHWVILRPLKGVTPKPPRSRIFDWEELEYRLYNRYQTVSAYVEGEFDHDIIRDSSPVYSEYISAPHMLVMEKVNAETIHWLKGEYLYPDELLQLFPKATLTERSGVGACQPFPRTFRMKDFNLLAYASLGILLMVQLFLAFSAQEKVIFQGSFPVVDSTGFVAPVVTHDFKVENTLFGRTNLEFNLMAPVANSWLETDVNLIHSGTDEEFSFQEGVEFYSGYDWSEGSTTSTATLSEINEGTYHMVINIYRDPSAIPPVAGFEVKLVQDVSMWSNFFLILSLLLIYPVILWIRKYLFEQGRWSQSDFGND